MLPKMRNGTLQKLSIYKYRKVQDGWEKTCKKVRRTKKSKKVDDALSLAIGSYLYMTDFEQDQ